MMRRNGVKRSAGFTLVEMTASIVASTILLVGLGSTVYIARQASDPAPAVESARQATSAAHDFASELKYATAINQRADNLVEFVAADLNGDNTIDTVRYAWNTVGTPLTRSINGATALPLGPALDGCELKYDVRTVTKYVPANSEGLEQRLSEYQPLLNLGSFGITANSWVGEYFEPALPAGTVSWRVTQVRFDAKTSGAIDGQIMVQLRRPTLEGLPSGSVIVEAPLAESLLTSGYIEQKINFPNCPALPPNSGVCVVLKHVSGATACNIQFCNLLVNTPNSDMVDTDTQGIGWSRYSGKSINHRLNIRTTNSQAQTQIKSYLNRATYKLKLTGGGEIRGAVKLLNEPEVP